jgi:hypothetical protein
MTSLSAPPNRESRSGISASGASGSGLGSPRALRQVVLIQRLPDQRLDDRLTAHVQIASGFIQLIQHTGRDIYVDALNRLYHSALSLEKPGNVLALIRQPCNRVGRNRFRRITSFLHTAKYNRSPTHPTARYCSGTSDVDRANKVVGTTPALLQTLCRGAHWLSSACSFEEC